MRYKPRTLKEQLARDDALIRDYQKQENGYWSYSTTELTMKYGIGGARIYQILAQHNIAKRNR